MDGELLRENGALFRVATDMTKLIEKIQNYTEWPSFEQECFQFVNHLKTGQTVDDLSGAR